MNIVMRGANVPFLYVIRCMYQHVHPKPIGASPKVLVLCPACTHLLDKQKHVTITSREIVNHPTATDSCFFCHRTTETGGNNGA